MDPRQREPEPAGERGHHGARSRGHSHLRCADQPADADAGTADSVADACQPAEPLGGHRLQRCCQPGRLAEGPASRRWSVD